MVILIVLSVIACIRFKPRKVDLSESGPFTHKNKAPQLIFYGILVGWVVMMFINSLYKEDLTRFYPQFVTVLALALLAPLGIQMLAGKKPATHFYDSELEDFGEHPDKRTNEYYLLWLVGMLILCSIFG